MIGKKLQIEGKAVKITITYGLGYDRMIAFELDGAEDEKAWKGAMNFIPLYFTDYLKLKEKYKGVQFKVESEDLTFERFWREYNNKVGKKQAAGQLWQKMPRKAKIAALVYIKTLHQQYKAKKWDLPLGDTYLRGKYWEAAQ